MRTVTRIFSTLLFCACTWLLLVANVPRLSPAELGAIAGEKPVCPQPSPRMRRWWFGE